MSVAIRVIVTLRPLADEEGFEGEIGLLIMGTETIAELRYRLTDLANITRLQLWKGEEFLLDTRGGEGCQHSEIQQLWVACFGPDLQEVTEGYLDRPDPTHDCVDMRYTFQPEGKDLDAILSLFKERVLGD